MEVFFFVVSKLGMEWDEIGWDGRFGLAVIGSTIKVL